MMMSTKQQIIYNNLVKIAEENGCEVVSLAYKSYKINMEFRCPKGHMRIISTSQFRNNPLGCRVCYENSSIEPEKNFLINVEKIGGKVIGKYKNISTRVECECSNGHICFPIPGHIQRGGGMCKKCVGNCPEEAEKIFISNVEKLGGKIVGSYKGVYIPVETICINGHTCFSTPGQIRRGGMCRKCINRCPKDSEKNFIKNIEKLGGKIIGKYINSTTKIECVCPNNHICYPVPQKIKIGRGMCKKCSGCCPEEAEKKFITNVDKLGGIVIGKYAVNIKAVECKCVNGHICFPIPARLSQGQGMCKHCVLEQSESKGEKITTLALDKLNISYTKQYIHSKLRRLRFDFQFYHQNTVFFIEFDGIQHQKYHKYFHHTPKEFDDQRQRDLMKNYLIKNTENCILIRLDHEWTTTTDAVDNLSCYLKECIDNPGNKIYAANKLYEWINDDPCEESIKKYFIDA